MALTRTKVVYSVKIKRGSAQPTISTERTGLKVQDVPPELCHLTGDALAKPFPPIALGGYIKYYRTHSEQEKPHETEERVLLDWEVQRSSREVKSRRRASSVSTLLGPLLSHMPKPWPSNEIPPKSHLFQIYSPASSEIPSLPASPTSPTSPRIKRRRFLSIIPEASQETMRTEVGDNATFSGTSRKSRVVSFPPAIPTSNRSSSLPTSALISSFTSERSSLVTSGSVPLSPGGSLRRKKRQMLRTPSVENDFAQCARELLGLSKNDKDIDIISRQASSGSDVTEEESLMSPTTSVNTAMTSLLDPSSSLPPSPSSPSSTKTGETNQSTPDNGQNTVRVGPAKLDPVVVPCHSSPQIESPIKSGQAQSIKSEDSSESESSPMVSTPPATFSGWRVLADEKLGDFLVVGFGDDDEGEERDSWASYATARSSPEPLPVVQEADESLVEEGQKNDPVITNQGVSVCV